MFYTHLRKFSEAQVWFDEAFADTHLEQQPLIHPILLSYLGNYHMARGDWENAQLRFLEALEIEERIGP